MKTLSRSILLTIFIVVVTTAVQTNAQTSQPYQIVDEYGGELIDTAFNGTETMLIVALPFRVEFYDLTADDLRLIDTLEIPEISRIAVTGNRLVIVHRSRPDQLQQISLYDVETRQQISRSSQWAPVDYIAGLGFSPDGEKLAFTTDGTLTISQGQNFSEVIRQPLMQMHGNQVKWSDDSRYLALNAPDLTIYDTEVQTAVQAGFAIYGDAPNLLYHDGKFAAYRDNRPEFAIWETDTSELKKFEIDVENKIQLHDVVLSPTLETVSFTIGREAYIVPVPEEAGTISPDDTLENVDPYPDDPVLEMISAATGQEAHAYNIDLSGEKTFAAIHYRVVPDGDIYSVFQEAIDIVDLRDQQANTLNRVFTPELDGFFDVDDTSATLHSGCGSVTVDFSTAPPQGTYESGCGEVYETLCGEISPGFIVESEFCYSEPGPALGGITVINIRRLDSSGEPTGDPLILQGHTDWINGFIFLPDERRLLTWSQDRSAILWTFLNEAGELELVDQQVFPFDSVPSEVDIDVTGNLMAVGDRSGRVSLYDIDLDSATYGSVLQTLDTLHGGVSLRFSENFLYTVSGGRVLRWQAS
jgi:WD40 repeat protein